MAVLGLRCCVGFFSGCNEGGTPRCRAQGSHCCGFFCYRAQAPGLRASVAMARGLQSTGSIVVTH